MKMLQYLVFFILDMFSFSTTYFSSEKDPGMVKIVSYLYKFRLKTKSLFDYLFVQNFGREFFTHMETSMLPFKGCHFLPILGTLTWSFSSEVL